jgi:hypothetical protein
VQQRRAERLGVEPHAGADLGDPDRVGDEVLTRLAPLIGVVDARVHKRLLDAVAIDRHRRVVGVLLDDREQISEQLALKRRQIVTLYLRPRVALADPVDPRPGGNRRRGRRAVAARTAAGVAAADRAAQALCGGFALLRYRRPSSCRCE